MHVRVMCPQQQYLQKYVNVVVDEVHCGKVFVDGCCMFLLTCTLTFSLGLPNNIVPPPPTPPPPPFLFC